MTDFSELVLQLVDAARLGDPLGSTRVASSLYKAYNAATREAAEQRDRAQALEREVERLRAQLVCTSEDGR